MIHSTDSPILFFDGVCNLCNKSVQFVIRHDQAGNVKFATLQSAAGEAARDAVLKAYGRVPDSIILYDNGRYYVQSTAALRLAGYLDGGWRFLKTFLFIPAFIREPLYKLIARNRYRWFGKQDECMLPTPALKARFLN
jgi:predicted DCC family thiol-disulfide oxidoreductase YuxK